MRNCGRGDEATQKAVLYYCGILPCDNCRIFFEQNDDKRRRWWSAKYELLVLCVAAQSYLKSSNPLSRVWSRCILVDVVVEIYLDVGNPSICQLPFSEDAWPAACRSDRPAHGCRHRHVSRLISTKRWARLFASHYPLIDDHVTIHSTPFHSTHRPQSIRITGRRRQRWRM